MSATAFTAHSHWCENFTDMHQMLGFFFQSSISRVRNRFVNQSHFLIWFSHLDTLSYCRFRWNTSNFNATLSSIAIQNHTIRRQTNCLSLRIQHDQQHKTRSQLKNLKSQPRINQTIDQNKHLIEEHLFWFFSFKQANEDTKSIWRDTP